MATATQMAHSWYTGMRSPYWAKKLAYSPLLCRYLATGDKAGVVSVVQEHARRKPAVVTYRVPEYNKAASEGKVGGR